MKKGMQLQGIGIAMALIGVQTTIGSLTENNSEMHLIKQFTHYTEQSGDKKKHKKILKHKTDKVVAEATHPLQGIFPLPLGTSTITNSFVNTHHFSAGSVMSLPPSLSARNHYHSITDNLQNLSSGQS